MVATFPIRNTSWWLFIVTASLLVNAWIIASVKIDTSYPILKELPSISINLMALAAPAPKPVVRQEPVPVVKKREYKKTIPKVATRADAVKKISTLNKKSEVKQKQEIAQKQVILQKPEIKEKVQKKVDHQIPLEPTQKKSEMTTPSRVASLNDNAGKQASNIIREARFRSQTPPVYPRRAYELGQQGTVILLAQVADNGKPKSLKIEASSGHRLLDSAAMAAVKKWEFESTLTDGQVSASWVRVPVRFVIQ